MVRVALAVGCCGLLLISPVLAQVPPTTGGNENYQSVSSSYKADVGVGNWNNEDYWNGPDGYKVPFNRPVGDEVWFYHATIPPSGLGLGGVTVHLDMSPVIAGLTISGGGKVIVGPNFALMLERRSSVADGDISNAGTIEIMGGASSSSLSFITDDTSFRQKVAGAGVIRLGSSSSSFLTGHKLLHEASHVIEGSGNVHFTELTNQGVMRTANSYDTLAIGLPSGISNAVLINTGVVEAAGGGTVHIRNGSVINANGVIRAKEGSTARIGVPVVGGTLSSSGTGVVEMVSGSLANVTIQGTMRVTGSPMLARDTTVIAGQTITNNGLVVFEPTGPAGGFTVAFDQITIDGNGEIDMGASGKGRIGGTGAHQLSFGAGQLVRGSGALGASQIAIINHGTIRADRALPLTVQPSSGGVINQGTLEAAGGTLRLAGQAIFLNTGGVIQHTGASSVELIGSGVTIAGGTLAGSGTGAIRIGTQSYLQNLTITGRVLVPAGSTAFLRTGTIVNDGIIRMEGGPAGVALARLNLGDMTLEGTGALEMTGMDNMVTSTAFAPVRTLTHGKSHSIRGGGQLGGGFLGIVNHGRILANAPTPLVIDPEGIGLTNHGVLEAANGATLTVTDSLTNYNASTQTLTGGRYTAYGTVRLANADIVNNSAWIDLIGPSSSLLRHTGGADALANFAANLAGGTLELMSGRSLASAGNLANAGTIAIGAGSTLHVGPSGTGTYTQTAGVTSGLGTLHAGIVQILGGHLEPGASPGVMTIDGNLVVGPDAELVIEIGGAALHDQLIVSGDVQLGGRLRVELVDGFQPTSAFAFSLISAANIAGGFAAIDLGAGLASVSLVPSAGGLELAMVPVPEPRAYLLFAAGAMLVGLRMRGRQRSRRRAAYVGLTLALGSSSRAAGCASSLGAPRSSHAANVGMA
ncbi:MAG: hypothetical protein IT495_22215 [Gammaproteobacteria bacterium]|nr:hypothetical protein [Gammaproteobacteria bacterium]